MRFLFAVPRDYILPHAHFSLTLGTSHHPPSTAFIEPCTQQAGQGKEAAAASPAALPQAREQTKELYNYVAHDTLIETYSFTSK